MVERSPEKAGVGGSTPSLATIISMQGFKWLPKVLFGRLRQQNHRSKLPPGALVSHQARSDLRQMSMLFALINLQIVRHREHIGNALGLRSGNLLVHLRCHRAF